MCNLKVQAAIRGALAAVLLLGMGGCYTTVADETFTFRKSVRVSRNQLRTNGYYCTKRYYSESSNIFTGTTVQCFILWQDGTVVRFSGTGKVKKDEVGDVVFGSLEEAHQHFQNYVDSLSAQPSWGKRSPWPNWGAYRVQGDSIFLQYMHDAVSGGFSHRFVALRDTGVVLDDTTFVLEKVYNAKPCADDTTTPYCRGTYHFRLWDEKPDSTNWLHERYR